MNYQRKISKDRIDWIEKKFGSKRPDIIRLKEKDEKGNFIYVGNKSYKSSASLARDVGISHSTLESRFSRSTSVIDPYYIFNDVQKIELSTSCVSILGRDYSYYELDLKFNCPYHTVKQRLKKGYSDLELLYRHDDDNRLIYNQINDDYETLSYAEFCKKYYLIKGTANYDYFINRLSIGLNPAYALDINEMNINSYLDIQHSKDLSSPESVININKNDKTTIYSFRDKHYTYYDLYCILNLSTKHLIRSHMQKHVPEDLKLLHNVNLMKSFTIDGKIYDVSEFAKEHCIPQEQIRYEYINKHTLMNDIIVGHYYAKMIKNEASKMKLLQQQNLIKRIEVDKKPIDINVLFNKYHLKPTVIYNQLMKGRDIQSLVDRNKRLIKLNRPITEYRLTHYDVKHINALINHENKRHNLNTPLLSLV